MEANSRGKFKTVANEADNGGVPVPPGIDTGGLVVNKADVSKMLAAPNVR